MTPTFIDYVKSDSPRDVVNEGYNPSYIACVCSCAGHLIFFVKAWLELFSFKNVHILDLTLYEELFWLLRLVVLTLIIVTYPISYWIIAIAQYYNMKAQFEFNKRYDDEI